MYDDDHEETRAREANPDPTSAPTLPFEHEATPPGRRRHRGWSSRAEPGNEIHPRLTR